MRFLDCKLFHMPQRSPEWLDVRRGKLTASEVGSWIAEEEKVPREITVSIIQKKLKELNAEFPAYAKRDDLLELCPEGIFEKRLTEKSLNAQKSAIYQLLGELSGCPVKGHYEVDVDGIPPHQASPLYPIWRGLRYEDEALESFTQDTGMEVEEVGFCLHKSGIVGCSPDGLIVGKNEGYENKVPLSPTHIKYLCEGILPEDYKNQIHLSMAVTGAEAWNFQSYCPKETLLTEDGKAQEIWFDPFRIRVERNEYTERVASGIERFTEEFNRVRDKISDHWKQQITD